jgi:hypothetical protein
LLEFTDKYSLITNSIQTISNQEILVTGGAYYINMTSNTKQLKISENKGLKVEFPRLSDDEMALFLGERDTFGQVNWTPTQQSFLPKDTEEPKKTIEPKLEKEKTAICAIENIPRPDDLDNLIDTIYSAPRQVKKDEVSEDEYQKNLKELEVYKKRLQDIENLKKTYQAIEILYFGWLNCDRFYKNPNPRTNIELTFNKDSVISARFFLVFKDINSILTEYYWINKKENIQFSNIPIAMDVLIIGLTVRDTIPYWFKSEISTTLNQTVNVDFILTTQTQIQEYLRQYSK